MERQSLNPGGNRDGWLKRFAVWVGLVAVVVIATEYPPLAVVGIMAGLYFVFRGVQNIYVWFGARSIDEVPIGSLGTTTGAVTVAGTVRPAGESTTAPMSEEATIAYRSNVREYRPQSGEESGSAMRGTYLDGGMEPFLLDDETGTVYVDPENAEMSMASGDVVELGRNEEPPAWIRDFAEREPDVDPVHKYRREFIERRIEPGDTVYVAGQVSRVGETADTDAVATLTDGPDTPRFFVSDDPDYGIGGKLLGEALVAFLIAGLVIGASALAFL